MNHRPEEMHSQDENVAAPTSPDTANEPATPNRRELIERYAKYALVGAPLLLFASKAHAIHSAP
jgi:hypothetical protein